MQLPDCKVLALKEINFPRKNSCTYGNLRKVLQFVKSENNFWRICTKCLFISQEPSTFLIFLFDKNTFWMHDALSAINFLWKYLTFLPMFPKEELCWAIKGLFKRAKLLDKEFLECAFALLSLRFDSNNCWMKCKTIKKSSTSKILFMKCSMYYLQIWNSSVKFLTWNIYFNVGSPKIRLESTK